MISSVRGAIVVVPGRSFEANRVTIAAWMCVRGGFIATQRMGLGCQTGTHLCISARGMVEVRRIRAFGSKSMRGMLNPAISTNLSEEPGVFSHQSGRVKATDGLPALSLVRVLS